MKKWFPFIALLSIALIFSLYLFFSSDSSPYIPQSSDPVIVYREACAHCHGKRGEGQGLFYPALNDEELTLDRVRQSVREGSFLMPDFPQIKGALLDSLAEIIVNRSYQSD